MDEIFVTVPLPLALIAPAAIVAVFALIRGILDLLPL